MKKLILILLLILISAPVYADDFQEGFDAAKRGDFKAALEIFRPLAEQGHLEAQRQLSRMYLLGEGVQKNFREAEKWSSLSAEKGDAEEQKGMGFMYELGIFVTKDLKKAAYWYRKAAKQGDVEAKDKLEMIVRQTKRANDLAIGSDAYKRGDYKTAWSKFKLSADQGNAHAQFNIGHMYSEDEGVTKDLREAIKWYKKAAE